MTEQQRGELELFIKEITLQKRTQRRKELWGNVVAAIEKYETELNEDISFNSPEGFCRHCDMREPGEIMLEYDN